MATVEELLIMYILNKNKKRRQRCKRRWSVRPLNISRLEDGEFFSLVLPMREIDDERHFQYFRMSAGAFDSLLRRVAPHIQHHKSHSAPVSAAERLAVTLRYLATGISQQALAASFKLGSATVSCIVREVCPAIWMALKDEFVYYPEGEQWEVIRKDFWELWNYPNCIGAIDGKHVRVRAPANSGSSFYNYKGFFSFILMAACDARYKFRYVDIGAYGRDSDAGVFSRSNFGSQLIKGTLHLPPPAPLPGTEIITPAVFVGDEAFPQKVNLMRPYSGLNLRADQRTYNYRHCRARRVIENAFGILAARWRVFGRALECSVQTAQDITKACVALHNYLCDADQFQRERERYITPVLMDTEGAPGEWRQATQGDTNLLDTQRLTAARATQDGMAVRDRLKDYFLTDEGRVTWQDAVVQRGTLH